MCRFENREKPFGRSRTVTRVPCAHYIGIIILYTVYMRVNRNQSPRPIFSKTKSRHVEASHSLRMGIRCSRAWDLGGYRETVLAYIRQTLNIGRRTTGRGKKINNLSRNRISRKR